MAAIGLALSLGCSQAPNEKQQPQAKQSKTPANQVSSTDTATTKPPSAKQSQAPAPLKKAELLVELPDYCSTPDAMCLLPSGDILVSVPNVNSWVQAVAKDKSNARQDPPPLLIRITKDNQVKKYYDPPRHPVTGKAFPFGLCIDAEGKNLYLTDLQWFADMENPGNHSRVLRIPLDENYNPAGEPVVLIEGMVVANAVIIRDGYLYVSDTSMVPKKDPKDPLISGIFRVKLTEEGTKLKLPLTDDPHLVATMKSYNLDVGFGADGLTFDSKGNLYCGNFADGTLHKIEFDADGNPTQKEAPVFARAPFMKSCDGIFCDLKTDKIYVADSLANAVQVVLPDGSVQTLAQDAENDGSGGRLDQPSEVLIRGREVVASNIDFPVPGGVNQTWDKPYTISVIKLD
jgi:sugar lactone lactonase YvrE